MADNNNKINDGSSTVESTDRGLFDFMKKKEDSNEEYKGAQEGEVISGVEKMHVSEPECKDEEKKHGSLLEKLHRSDSSSSSSSDEEGDDEEKKKKKKEKKEKKKAGLKEKIEEKIGVHKEEHHHEDTAVPIEKVHVQENVYSEPSYPAPPAEEKKGGFLDKIKEKLPGTTKPDEHTAAVAAPVQAATEPCAEGDKEKKGFLDKIKEKIPGFHPKSDAHEEKKDHD